MNITNENESIPKFYSYNSKKGMISEDNDISFINENNKTKKIKKSNQINTNSYSINSLLRQSKTLKTVRCTIEFLQIGEVDTMNERYQAIVKIKARWHEKTEITGEYDSNLDWNPKLYVENILHEKSMEQVSYEVINENTGKTIIIETRIVKGWFWERMELNDFPLDIQELSVCLGSKLNPKYCRLISDPDEIFLFKNSRCTSLSSQVINTFRDQQKFFVFIIYKLLYMLYNMIYFDFLAL
jgi:hypothetical protein